MSSLSNSSSNGSGGRRSRRSFKFRNQSQEGEFSSISSSSVQDSINQLTARGRRNSRGGQQYQSANEVGSINFGSSIQDGGSSSRGSRRRRRHRRRLNRSLSGVSDKKYQSSPSFNQSNSRSHRSRRRRRRNRRPSDGNSLDSSSKNQSFGSNIYMSTPKQLPVQSGFGEAINSQRRVRFTDEVYTSSQLPKSQRRRKKRSRRGRGRRRTNYTGPENYTSNQQIHELSIYNDGGGVGGGIEEEDRVRGRSRGRGRGRSRGRGIGRGRGRGRGNDRESQDFFGDNFQQPRIALNWYETGARPRQQQTPRRFQHLIIQPTEPSPSSTISSTRFLSSSLPNIYESSYLPSTSQQQQPSRRLLPRALTFTDDNNNYLPSAYENGIMNMNNLSSTSGSNVSISSDTTYSGDSNLAPPSYEEAISSSNRSNDINYFDYNNYYNTPPPSYSSIVNNDSSAINGDDNEFMYFESRFGPSRGEGDDDMNWTAKTLFYPSIPLPSYPSTPPPSYPTTPFSPPPPYIFPQDDGASVLAYVTSKKNLDQEQNQQKTASLSPCRNKINVEDWSNLANTPVGGSTISGQIVAKTNNELIPPQPPPAPPPPPSPPPAKEGVVHQGTQTHTPPRGGAKRPVNVNPQRVFVRSKEQEIPSTSATPQADNNQRKSTAPLSAPEIGETISSQGTQTSSPKVMIPQNGKTSNQTKQTTSNRQRAKSI